METTTGGRIEQARIQLGYSLPQLARRIGVKRKTLENWENDRSEPRADRLLKLSGVLQVPLVWLLTGESPESKEVIPPVTETAMVARKLDRALVIQQELAALLIDITADVSRMQRVLDSEKELAA